MYDRINHTLFEDMLTHLNVHSSLFPSVSQTSECPTSDHAFYEERGTTLTNPNLGYPDASRCAHCPSR